MAWVGRSITVGGVILVLLPVIGGVLHLLDRQLPFVLEYAPTFVLGGIFFFVLGIAIQTVLGR